MILIRALLSWLPKSWGFPKPILRIFEIATDPVVVPIRKLIFKWKVVQAFPIDVTYIVAYLIISVIKNYLGTLL